MYQDTCYKDFEHKLEDLNLQRIKANTDLKRNQKGITKYQ